jgi:radical SAM protein with 4Fe4S-binding SPASM domain
MEAKEFLPEDSRFSRYRNIEDLTLKRVRGDCRRLLYSAIIDWNGSVVPCCFDKNEDFVMGNALEQPFDEIWWGRKFVEFRNRINKGKRPSICENCTEGIKNYLFRISSSNFYQKKP